MGAPSREEEEAKKMEAGGDTVGQKLDAGALFVLQSKGSWLHCGYHLTTSIVAAPFAFAFAFAALGWSAGMVCLVIGAAVTFYSYNLLSRVLEHHAQQGRRQLRFRDMAADILGPGWARCYIGPIQFMVCFGVVVASTLLAGQSMKAIYLIANPGGTMKLYVFVAIFGVFLVILAQLPSFHSLRHVNLVSLLLCLSYSLCAVAGCVYLGTSDRAPPKDYSIAGDTHTRVCGVFNALAVIATTYGNGIIPEIQLRGRGGPTPGLNMAKAVAEFLVVQAKEMAEQQAILKSIQDEVEVSANRRLIRQRQVEADFLFDELDAEIAAEEVAAEAPEGAELQLPHIYPPESTEIVEISDED